MINIDANLYSRIVEKINDGVLSFLSTSTSAIISATTPSIITFLAIYIVLWGWAMMRGLINEPIGDGVARIVRLSLIAGLSTSLGLYAGYISEWIWETPDALAKIISGEDATSSVVFLDNLLSRFFTLASGFIRFSERESTLGIPDLTLFFSAIGILVAGVLTTAYAAFIFILTKMALAVLLSIGPIFIGLAIFEATKKFLEAWIGQVLNYVFLTMLCAACVKLVLVLIEHYFVVMINTEPNIGDAMQLIAIALIGFLVLLQMPSIASGLGGGVALSTLNALGWAASKLRNSGKSTLNIVNGKTLADHRGSRKRKADLARWAARAR